MTNPFPHPLVLGHRGAPLEAPENSLRSFDLALRHGADGVELDVRLARDGTPVVIHDETLDRTGHGTGAVAARTRAELAALRGGAEPIPTLEDAAGWAAERGAWLNVELKAPGAEASTLELLRGAGVLSRTVLSSFHPAAVAEVGRLAPEARRFLLTEAWDAEAQRMVADSGAQGVCLGVEGATPLALEVLGREALPVIVWTVDDAARMRELFRAGVAALITNHPAVGAATRAQVFPG